MRRPGGQLVRAALLASLLLPRVARAQPATGAPPDAAPADASPPATGPDTTTGDTPPSGDGDGDGGKDKGKDKDKDAGAVGDTNEPIEDKLEKHEAKEKAKDKGKKDKYVPEVGGYIQAMFQDAIDTNDDGTVKPTAFRLPRVRLKVNGKIIKKVGYSVEIDPRAPILSGVLRDAYVHVKYIPFHELRVGQQKTQFGYENVESSTKLYTVNRSKVSDNLARGISLRDIGIGIIGEVPIAGGFSVEDAVTLVNGAGANVQSDNNESKDVWGRLGGHYENKPLDLDLRAGGSLGVIKRFDPGVDPNSTIDDTRYDVLRLGGDLEADTRWAFVAAEYVWGRDTDQQTNREFTAKGYYVTAAGKTPWKVGPVFRYDWYTGDYKRYTFGAYYGARSAALRAMINYERRPGRDDRFYLWAQAKF